MSTNKTTKAHPAEDKAGPREKKTKGRAAADAPKGHAHITEFVNPDKIKRGWHTIDAKDHVLGKVATEAAGLLRGKYKPTFSPAQDAGDFVIVINSAHVVLTGRKWNDKHYYHHSGFVGGIKGETAAKLHARKPTAIIENAVQGMLPKGPLGRKMLKKLFVYAGAEHPHAAQQPVARKLPAKAKSTVSHSV